jgi:hypothetical protein
MADVQFPSDNERKAFLEKLGQFRSTLPSSEQRMLDAMATAGPAWQAVPTGFYS